MSDAKRLAKYDMMATQIRDICKDNAARRDKDNAAAWAALELFSTPIRKLVTCPRCHLIFGVDND